MPITAVAATSSGPLFSMTLIAPTTNPARRQWASIITSSLDSANIGANLVFVSFTVLLNDFFGCPTGCPTALYSNGGFDAGFVGFNVLNPLPDYGTQDVTSYRNTGPADVPPIGSDYYFFDNATYNNLSNQYDQTFTQAGRIPIIQQMAAIIAQERPAMVLFYPASVYAYPSYLQSWSTNVVNPGDVATDYSHWKVGTGAPNADLNIAEPGDVAEANVLPTSAQNSFYGSYLTGNINACGECLDARTNTYYDGTVTSVTSSADHLTWTVTELPHTFSDGVAVTANDFIYTQMAELISAVGYVGEGSAQSILGLSSSFTWTNGTTDYVFNGTYYNHNLAAAQAAGYNISAGTSFTASSPTTWTFTMSTPYVFTDPVITGASALPMEIYSEFPFSQWSTGILSGFSSSGGLSTSSYTYNWGAGIWGSAGSYTAYGAVGDGPYVYHGYDPVANVGTLVRNPTYWNATALQANGYDAVTTVHVDYINGKDAAVAALSTGSVNFLDSNYQFNAQDVASFKATPGTTTYIASGPTAGWQEMGLNLGSPVWGTGTATPACAGTCSAAQAHQYALDVREAISLLIPRSYIVDTLEGGLGTAGIEQFAPAFSYIYAPSQWAPKGIASDPYNPTLAKSYLAAAGYNTGVAPPATTGLPPISTPTISGVTVPSFLLGNSFTLSGTFPVDPVLGATSNGFAVTLQEYTTQASCPDTNASCWTGVALGSTNTGGAFSISYSPTATGVQEYRVFFTGIPETVAARDGWTTPTQAQSEVKPYCTSSGCLEGAPLNVTDTYFTQSSSITVGTLGSLIQGLVTSIDSGFQNLSSSTQASISALSSSSAKASDVTALTNSVNSLTSQVSSLNNSLSTAQDVAYAAIAIAIVLGIAAIALARRKPSA
jgi:hypothetical protein